MRSRSPRRFLAVFLAVVIVGADLPVLGGDPAAAADGPDLRLEHLGWDPIRPGIIQFRVTNVGNASAGPTTGKGETLQPPVSQDTAPPIPALAPQASFDVLYPLYYGLSCDDDRVRMSVPLADDTSSDDNALEVQLCDKQQGADLKIESLPFDPANAQVVTLRVSNIGVEPTEETGVRVEALAPVGRDAILPIPALEPNAEYEVAYQLRGATGCDGHELRVSVPLANDRYPPDNTRQVQVCAAKPAPAPEGPIVVGPAPRQLPPEHLRPGPQTLTFTPTTRPTLTRRPEVPPSCLPILQADRPSTVGFQNYFVNGCALHEFRQISFTFDFSRLRGQRHLPVSAVLSYRETVYHELAPNGARVFHPGEFQISCGLRLGRPTVDWAGRGGRIPYDDARSQNRIGRFDQILEWMPWMINDPKEEARGLILVGPNEAMNDDNAACLSQISGIDLEYNYVIPDR